MFGVLRQATSQHTKHFNVAIAHSLLPRSTVNVTGPQIGHDGGVPLTVAYTFEYCWHAVPGGTAVAANQVASRLAAHPEIDLVGVAGRHTTPPTGGYAPPVDVAQLPLRRPWLYQAWNYLGWPRIERAVGAVDICHTPFAIPAATSAPQVVTVHDLAFVHHPERFTAHGVRTMRRGLARCRGVATLITSTRMVADELVAYGFDHNQISVVPLGVDITPPTHAAAVRTLEPYRLPDQFVLFVGTQEPRKNLARLVEATRACTLDLVIAGGQGWGEPTPVADHVTFLGHVDDDVLAALYTTATVFAYPSLEEGFGLPVLEAMACGTPVVTSAGIATQEVAGGADTDAAVLVDPTDVTSIADGLSAALQRADELVIAGYAHASAKSWDAAVASTIETYRQALA